MDISNEIFLSRPQDLPELDGTNLSDALLEAADGASAITILTAYFDTETLRNICRTVPRADRPQCRVRVVVGTDGRPLLMSVVEEMRKLDLRLRKLKFKDVVIKVYTRGAPFHTKLYYFLRRTSPTWFIGSANASNAINGDRHELMVRTRGRHEALEAYVKAVIDAATDVAATPPKEVRDLRSFMLAGSVGYLPPASNPFAFSAVRLSPQQRIMLDQLIAQGSNVAYADVRTEGFSFGLARALTGTDPDEDDDEGGTYSPVAERSLGGSSAGRRPRYRHLGIETVYGFWIPERYAGLVEAQLKIGQERRLAKLQELARALEGNDDAALNVMLEEHLATMSKLLTEHNAGPLEERKNLKSSYGKFLENNRKRLGDAEWCERHVRRLILSRMPDIWNDDLAVHAFLSSYLEDVSARASAPGNRHHIIRVLLSELGLDDDDGEPPMPEEIREALEQRLLHGWERSDWEPPRSVPSA